MGAPITDLIGGLAQFPTNHPRIYGGLSTVARTAAGAYAGNKLGSMQAKAVQKQEMAQSNYIAQMNAQALKMQADNQAFLQSLGQNAINQMNNIRSQQSGIQQSLQAQTLANQSAANAALGPPLVNNTGDYNGLLTLASSPQGDMRRPNLGRSRLSGS